MRCQSLACCLRFIGSEVRDQRIGIHYPVNGFQHFSSPWQCNQLRKNVYVPMLGTHVGVRPMDPVTRCLHCGKRMVPIPSSSGPNELKCVFCDKLDPQSTRTSKAIAQA